MQGAACCHGVCNRKGQDHVTTHQHDCHMHSNHAHLCWMDLPFVLLLRHELMMTPSDNLQRADWTHGNVELCQIWGHMSEHRCLSPIPT